MATRYTAAALAACTRPVCLTIGRVSDRRGWQWLSRWWVRTARTWVATPLSVPQMLALQATRHDLAAYDVTLRATLRAVLPWRWRYRLVGDPVRLILSLPRELMEAVLKALVTVPGLERDVSREDDGLEALARLQRRAAHGDVGPQHGVSLAVAALSVRATFGDGWYWNPQRWPTSDGYVPFALALVEAAGVQALEVRRRLEVADGHSLAHAKPHERAKMQGLAYPSEVC